MARTCRRSRKQSSPVMRSHSTTSGVGSASSGILWIWRGERAHADDGGQREADRLGVDDGAVAGDDPVALEAPDALGHRRRRQPDAAPELGEGHAAVALELFEQTTVDLVQAVRFVGHRLRSPSIVHGIAR